MDDETAVKVLKTEDNEDLSNSFEKAKSQLPVVTDSQSEIRRIAVEIEPSTAKMKTELRALPGQFSSQGLDSDIIHPQHDLLEDDPDDGVATCDLNSTYRDTGSDSEWVDNLESGVSNDDNSDGSSGEKSYQRSVAQTRSFLMITMHPNTRFSDNERGHRSLKAPMPGRMVSVTISKSETFFEKDASQVPTYVEQATQNAKPRSRRGRKSFPEQDKDIGVSKEEMTRSMERGLRKLVGHTELTNELYPQSDINDDNNPESPPKGKPRKAAHGEPTQAIENLLAKVSVVTGAQKNAAKPAIPVSSQTDKKKALKDIAKKITDEDPTADKREISRDVSSLLAASKLFRNKPHMDGVSGWRMAGMKQNILHHQVRLKPFWKVMAVNFSIARWSRMDGEYQL